jgi:excisionase family DNA binding protein
MPKVKPAPAEPVTLPAGVRQYLTAAEIAVMLRKELKTIYTMVGQRRIPFRRCGRELLFDPEEIDEWMRKAAA